MTGDFLCQLRKNGQMVEVPLSISTIQQMIFDNMLKPDDKIKSIGDEKYTPLYNHPELVDFPRLKEDMTKAYQYYDEETTIRRCEQILDFDRTQTNPERIDALLVKGMILHKRDSKQAEKCYLGCLDFIDADLYPVVLNNLGVVNLQLNNIPQAIAYLEDAARRGPDFMAAQINLAFAYKEMAKARKRSLSDHNNYVELAAQKEAEIFEKVEKDPALLDKLLEKRNFPCVHEALVLYYGDVPSAFGVHKHQTELRTLAMECFEAGRDALANKCYYQAILMFKMAMTHDRTLEPEAQRHISLAEDKIRFGEAATHQNQISEMIETINEIYQQGGLEKAIEEATKFQSLISEPEQRQQVANIIDWLRKELAQKHFDQGCALEEEGKWEEALEQYRETLRCHQSFRKEIDLRLAVIKAHELWQEFKEELQENNYERALQIARQMRILSPEVPFVQDAEAMEEEIRRAIWNAFESGINCLLKGETGQAKKIFFKTCIISPGDTLKTETIFRLLHIFENEPALEKAIAYFILEDYERSCIAMKNSSPEIKHEEYLNEYQEMFFS